MPLASRTPGRIFENLIILGSATGEGYLAPPGDIRAFDVRHRQAGVGLPYDSAPRRVRIRHVAERRVQVHGRRRRLGRNHRRRESAALCTCRPPPPSTNSTAETGTATISTRIACSRSMRAPANTSGISRPFITISGIIDPAAAPQLVTVQHDGKTVDAVALARRMGSSMCSTALPETAVADRGAAGAEVRRSGRSHFAHPAFPDGGASVRRQGMTVKDMYDGFMTPEEKAQWKDRLSKARNGLYTPPALVRYDPDSQRERRRAVLQRGRRPANGTVYVESKDMPSIIKLVPAGESTAANAGGLIPDGRAGGRGGAARGSSRQACARRAARFTSRACQVCHGPDLKGDRGPQIDNAMARLGADAVATPSSQRQRRRCQLSLRRRGELSTI